MVPSTFKFIREFHRIPRSQKLTWCIIFYPNAERREWREKLGVSLVGTDKALDIASGKFIQVRSDQQVIEVTRRTMGDWYIYESEGGSTLRLPRCFVSDMYYNRVFSRDLLENYLI